jgi:hypothetical protein
MRRGGIYLRRDVYIASSLWVVVCVGSSIYARTPAFLLLLIPLALIWYASRSGIR